MRLVSSTLFQASYSISNTLDNFTPEDAAVLLQKEPFANIEARLDKSAAKVFTLEPPRHVQNDPVVSSATNTADAPVRMEKARFVITDVSNVKKKEMYIRDLDGQLRRASRAERWWQRNAEPKYMHNK